MSNKSKLYVPGKDPEQKGMMITQETLPRLIIKTANLTAEIASIAEYIMLKLARENGVLTEQEAAYLDNFEGNMLKQFEGRLCKPVEGTPEPTRYHDEDGNEIGKK